MSKTFYVYAIGREEGPIKIGITSSIITRLRSLQNGCSYKLEILYVMPAGEREDAAHHEKMFHDVYAENRLSGEWFDLDAEQAIEGIQTSFQIQEWLTHEVAFKKLYGVTQ